MLTEGRIPLTEAEGEAIARLLDGHDGVATLTRRDPGETGPVLVHIGGETLVTIPLRGVDSGSHGKQADGDAA